MSKFTVCALCKHGPNFWPSCSRIDCCQRKPITAAPPNETHKTADGNYRVFTPKDN
jgi:hypothetical protein